MRWPGRGLAVYLVAINLAGAACAWGLPAWTAEPSNHAEYRDMLNLFMAPDAPGVPLAECPTAACQQMQMQIGEMLGAGATREEIIEYFTGIYGTQILASPPAEGFFLLIWIVPLLALAVGAYLTYCYTRRIKKAG